MCDIEKEKKRTGYWYDEFEGEIGTEKEPIHTLPYTGNIGKDFIKAGVWSDTSKSRSPLPPYKNQTTDCSVTDSNFGA